MANRRRGSSIGEVNLGDTQVTSLATSRAGELRSRRRQESLSGVDLQTANQSAHQKGKKQVQPPAKGFNRGWLQAQEFAYKYSYAVPAIIISAVYGAWWVFARDDPEHPLNAFVAISYEIPGTYPVEYGKGLRDIAFVAFYSIVFTFIREFSMQALLRPLAKFFGLKSKHKVNRFLEQTYAMLYYGFSGPAGLYIMYHSPMWYFNTDAFYEDFPHKTHTVLFKLFYLLQAAFWSQQALVLALQLEKRRRDFRELVFHHLITIALISLSYRFHFTHMGLAIYITMDISDFFLATSKTLNYLDSMFVAPFFVLFVGVWIYFRHYLNIIILWSIVTDFSTIGSFELNWVTEQYKCWISQYITFALLFGLQLVNIYWLVLILRILYRYIIYDVTEDVRSDNEDSDEE